MGYNYKNQPCQMESPLISILTVCLNDCVGLQKTINSVEKALVPGVEHFIKDGNSSDDTQNYLRNLPHVSYRRYVSKVDRGIYDAMNEALQLASGQFVLMLNSGDTLRSNTLEQWVAYLKSYPETDLICCSLQWNRLGLAPVTLQPPMEIRNPTLMPVWHQSALIRKSFHERFGEYRTDYKMISDMIFYHRAFPYAKSVYLNFVSSEMGAGGISETHRWKQYCEFIRYLWEIEAPTKEYLRISYKFLKYLVVPWLSRF